MIIYIVVRECLPPPPPIFTYTRTLDREEARAADNQQGCRQWLIFVPSSLSVLYYARQRAAA